MGRALNRKKQREAAKEEKRLKRQAHHDTKRRRVDPPALPPPPAAAAPTASTKKARPAPPAAAAKPLKKSATTKPTRVLDPTTAAALAREEEELKMLEKKLGLNRKKKLPKEFDADGLSFILGWQDDVDELRGASGLAGADGGADGDGSEALDEASDSGDAVDSASEEAQSEDADMEGVAADDDAAEGAAESDGESEGEAEAAEDEGDEDSDGEGEAKEGGDDGGDADEGEAMPAQAAPVASASKYVPPALRRAASDTEAVVQRRIRAALNKLSPANVNGIVEEVEGVFGTAPRAEVTAALVQGLVTNAAAAFGRAQIAARAALLAALGGSMGGDVVGAVLTATVQRLDALLSEPSAERAPSPLPSAAAQDATALLSLLSAMLGLGVTSARLMFDLANRLADDFSDHNIDLLYQLLSHSGFVLRDADAVSLKTLIATVQQKAGAMKATEGRIKYLLESLTNLKNNKRSLQADDALEPLKKWLRTRARRCEVQEGGWQDWREGGAAKRWVSGPAAKLAEDEAEESHLAAIAPEEAALEALARKERMNTPGRRAVFCVLMGSEDYADAVEKLSRIGVQGRAERDVGAVLLHCASREAKFNPFYAHVAAKLCSLRHSYRVTFQFAFWDKLKEADSIRLPELANLAKLLAHLSGLFALSLSVLRVIEFEPLSPRHLLFLRLCLTHLFTSFPEATILSVMRRLCSAPNTTDLREGLAVLVEKGIEATGLTEASATKLKRGLRITRKVFEEAEQKEMGEPEEAAEDAENEDED